MEKYDNLGLVGEGSYGLVMKCRHKESGQVVAIKKFLESEDDKMVKKIALREVRLLRKLRHENLVNLIEVFRRHKRLYLVFEFVDHTVLDDLEKYPNGLSEMTVQKILWQVLRGVEFCHSHNIIHRDIKPENILNSRSGVTKICDFGFARTLAVPGEIYTDYVATRWYRSPELLVGDTKYGRGVDIWAIGCLAGEMLQGDPVFPGKSDLDQLNKILNCVGNLCPRHQEIFKKNPLFIGIRLPEVRDVEPLEKRFPKFSNEVLDFMKLCLKLDPIDRSTATSLLEHEFFKKDGFEEKVIPDLRSKILKDLACNVLIRKECEKRELERRKKIKEPPTEIVQTDSNNSSNISLSKKSSDSKTLYEQGELQGNLGTQSLLKENAVATTSPSTENNKQSESGSEIRQETNAIEYLPAVELANKTYSTPSDPQQQVYVHASPPRKPKKQNMPPINKKTIESRDILNSIKSNDKSASQSTSDDPSKNSLSQLEAPDRETIKFTSSTSDTLVTASKPEKVPTKPRTTDTFHKSIDNEQKQPSYQGVIPPIQQIKDQNNTSPHAMTEKRAPIADCVGTPDFKLLDKARRSSFDRSLYPDKITFEKMIMSLHGSTSISHPAIKKKNPANVSTTGSPPSVLSTSDSGAGGGNAAHPHFRHLVGNMTMWSSNARNHAKKTASPPVSDDTAAKSNDPNQAKIVTDKKLPENFTKRGQKNLKVISEDKPSGLKNEVRNTILPDLGVKPAAKPILGSERLSDPKPIGQDTLKAKKMKAKVVLASISTIDNSSKPHHRGSICKTPKAP